MVNAVFAMGLLGLFLPSSLSMMERDPMCSVSLECPFFDVHKFEGDWYVHGAFLNEHAVKFQCSTISITIEYNGEVRIVDNTYDKNYDGKSQRRLQGIINNLDQSCKWNVVSRKTESTGEYWILDTDYNNYAITLLCPNSTEKSPIQARILTRRRGIPGPLLNKAFIAANKHGLRIREFVTSDYSNCKNMPIRIY